MAKLPFHPMLLWPKASHMIKGVNRAITGDCQLGFMRSSLQATLTVITGADI